MIRPATAADVPQVVAMAMQAAAETGYGQLIPVDAGCLTAIAEELVASVDGALLVAARGTDVDGVIALHVFTHPLSGERVAADVAWWVDPAHRGDGVRLLRAAEQWARAQGVSAIHMSTQSSRVERFYESAGYVPIGRMYQRRLN